jgi:hypothetical protein
MERVQIRNLSNLKVKAVTRDDSRDVECEETFTIYHNVIGRIQ